MAALRNVIVVSPVPILGVSVKGGAQRVLASTVRALQPMAVRCVVVHSAAWETSLARGQSFEDSLATSARFFAEQLNGHVAAAREIAAQDVLDLISRADLVLVSDRHIGRLPQRSLRVLVLSNLAYSSEQVAARAACWDAVWVPSDYLRDQLLGQYGHEPSTVRVIPPVLHRSYLPLTNDERGRPNSLAFPHRADPEKGLLDAVGLLGRLLELDARWRMTVTYPSAFDDRANKLFFAWALREAQALGLRERIVLVHWREHGQVRELYAQSACTLMASRLPEAFGLVPIESVASGTPAVVLATGALAAQRGRVPSVHLVPEVDAAETAEVVQQAAQERVDFAARQRIVREYCYANHVRQVRAALASLHAQRSA